MERTEYISLLHKRLTGRLTAEEARRLESWIAERKERQEEARLIKTIWEKAPEQTRSVQPDVDAAWSKFQNRLTETPATSLKVVGRRSLFRRLAVAASFLVIVALTWTFWPTSNENWVALETHQQPQSEIKLPDGSVIWLNTNSKLAYSVEDGKSRQVTLEGEAFFKVARDEERPFQIQTPQGTVTVLGTAFNVRAYPNEGFEEVTVEEGKVAFNPKAIAEKTILGAKQKATFQKSSNTLSADWDEDDLAMAWKTGVFRFRGMPLEDVLVWSERHFQISIDRTQVADLLSCPYTTIWKDTEAEDALQALALAFEMQLEKVDNSTFRLKGGSCQ